MRIRAATESRIYHDSVAYTHTHTHYTQTHTPSIITRYTRFTHYTLYTRYTHTIHALYTLQMCKVALGSLFFEAKWVGRCRWALSIPAYTEAQKCVLAYKIAQGFHIRVYDISRLHFIFRLKSAYLLIRIVQGFHIRVRDISFLHVILRFGNAYLLIRIVRGALPYPPPLR